MPRIDRRDMLHAGLAWAVLPGAAILNLGCMPEQNNRAQSEHGAPNTDESPVDQSNGQNTDTDEGSVMRVHYLEIVTPDVDGACALYSQLHGVTFSEADQNLGGARTVKLAGGGMVGIRAPMHDGEGPVVRPYVLVDDIEAAVAAAAKAGAQIAVPPMKIPSHGTCAIFFQSGIEYGLWQL